MYFWKLELLIYAFEYDENGHIKQKNGAFGEVVTYQYDAEGRLIEEVSNSGTIIGYYYDALGNRIAKGTSSEYNRRIKTDLKEWMKGVDREAHLRLSRVCQILRVSKFIHISIYQNSTILEQD